ncbi:LON peptidase substrate-binding domain-containing protein [bacterium]|nr:LON peptidase substrate-binding domain-containing protein [bacterium]
MNNKRKIRQILHRLLQRLDNSEQEKTGKPYMYNDPVIPIFPISRILFPKMVLPLHIFEEKYKSMISYCESEALPFGILAGDEVAVGGIGTSAGIHSILKRYNDGRYDLLAVGKNRFRIEELIFGKPFIQARVSFFNDIEGMEISRLQISEMLTLYNSFIDRLGLNDDQRDDLLKVVEEVDVERELSYIIGQTIGLNQKQQIELLASINPIDRVDWLSDQLRRHQIIHRLAQYLYEKKSFDPQMN